MIRYVITKSTAQGEQLTVEVAQCNPVTGETEHTREEVAELVDDAVAHADMRMIDMNLKMLEAYELEKHFDPHTWNKVISILDILAGRQTAAMVVQRWEASIEETQALADLRQEAYDNREPADNGDSQDSDAWYKLNETIPGE